MTRTRRTLHFATGVVLCTIGSQGFAQTPTNDLMFIVDRSDSIILDEWNLQVDGLLECICGDDSIIPEGSIDKYKVTVIAFGGTATIPLGLNGVLINPTTRPDVCTAIHVDLRDVDTIGSTLLDPALLMAQSQFIANPDAISRMLVVSTDGGMTDPVPAKAAFPVL